MFNSPAHHAQVVVKPYVGRAPRPREPGARCWLVVEIGHVGFDAQERDKVIVVVDAEPASGLVCAPQSRLERRIVGKFRVFIHEIPEHTTHETLCINLGERRNLFDSQLKHTDAPCSIRWLSRSASRLWG
jgi:hypothetical protein